MSQEPPTRMDAATAGMSLVGAMVGCGAVGYGLGSLVGAEPCHWGCLACSSESSGAWSLSTLALSGSERAGAGASAILRYLDLDPACGRAARVHRGGLADAGLRGRRGRLDRPAPCPRLHEHAHRAEPRRRRSPRRLPTKAISSSAASGSSRSRRSSSASSPSARTDWRLRCFVTALFTIAAPSRRPDRFGEEASA